MKIIKYQDIKDDGIFQKKEVISDINFLTSEEGMEVLQAANSDINTLEKWFYIIGIKHDSIKINGQQIVYSVGNVELSLAQLSSGERILLYLLACKVSNKPIIVKSLFERMGNRLENVVYNNLTDYENLTIILYNADIKPEFTPYFVKEI